MYWRNPERQKEAVIDGWSLSGDYAYKDEDGLFWHVSRIDDIIKSRGYRVSPGEVEDALNEHQAVYESSVIGVPDPEQGQRVKAFVILKAGFAGSPELVEEMRAFVKEDASRPTWLPARSSSWIPCRGPRPARCAGSNSESWRRGVRRSAKRPPTPPAREPPDERAVVHVSSTHRSARGVQPALAEHGQQAKILAGGTDVLVKMKHRRLTPPYLINIKSIPGLDYIRYEAGRGSAHRRPRHDRGGEMLGGRA